MDKTEYPLCLVLSGELGGVDDRCRTGFDVLIEDEDEAAVETAFGDKGWAEQAGNNKRRT